MKVVNAIPKAAIAALTPDNDPKKFRPPNSIAGLSPKSPMLLALDRLPIEAPHIPSLEIADEVIRRTVPMALSPLGAPI